MDDDEMIRQMHEMALLALLRRSGGMAVLLPHEFSDKPASVEWEYLPLGGLKLTVHDHDGNA